VPSPDPGRALITGNFLDMDVFKIPILRNIKNTAPYFHDNSAATLQDVVDHYSTLFEILPNAVQFATPPGTVVPNGLSDQDKQDIIAFMELL
jgi:cytochrome c peroxidase